MNASRPVLVLANGATGPDNGRDTLILEYKPDDPGRLIHIGLPSFIDDLFHIPDRTLDLLEIAAYAFAADRLLHRGQSNAVEYHSWSRSIEFHVRVRDFDFWNTDSVRQALSDVLLFMTGDASITFHFQPGHCTHPTSLFDSSEFSLKGLADSTVTLFSGGIDSLSGALDRLNETNSKVLLVTHQSGVANTHTQQALVRALQQEFPRRTRHYRFRCTLHRRRAVEETQRTRSFLYASIGYAIASAWKNDHIFIYENGVTSINLSRREDLANARASRTTHPRTICLLERLFGLLRESEFRIRLPYLTLTKRDVVKRLSNNAPNLLSSTVSCTRTFETEGQSTHCGACFQCIDRRIATYAAGVNQVDHQGLYSRDIVNNPIEDRAARTIAVDYLRQAKRFTEWNLAKFEHHYLSEIAELIGCLPGQGTEEQQIEMVWRLLQNHGEHVSVGVQNMLANRCDPLEPLADNSLLALLTSGEHTKPEVLRLAQSLLQILKPSVGEMFRRDRPRDENDLNTKLAALLRTHEPQLASEHPTESFACAGVVPDHELHSSSLLLEAKYIRKSTSPSKAAEGIAADLTKFPANCFVLFIVYDPDHAIRSDYQYRRDIESIGRNVVVIVR